MSASHHSTEPVIVTSDLTKHYRDGAFTAVDHLNLTVHQGEIFGLLGPNVPAKPRRPAC